MTFTSARISQDRLRLSITKQIWKCHIHDYSHFFQTSTAGWRHQIETFSALLALCEGNSLVTGKFPTQRPVTPSFDVFFDLRPNKRTRKPSRRRWYQRPLRSLWRHCNGLTKHHLGGNGWLKLNDLPLVQRCCNGMNSWCRSPACDKCVVECWKYTSS